MHRMLSSDVLQELAAVEGRYIEWEWDPRTLKNDYITLREASGHHVVGHDKNGREFSLYVARDIMQRSFRLRRRIKARLKFPALPANRPRPVVLQPAKDGLSDTTACSNCQPNVTPSRDGF